MAQRLPPAPRLGSSSSQPAIDNAASLDDNSDSPRIQKRPRRTHARRSCQMCQQRKARCELPDLEVPSSPLPLPDHQSCHRCKTLQISCVVDDANKKKAKKPASDKNIAPPAPPKKRLTTAADRPGMQKSSTNASSSSIGDRISVGSSASSSTAALIPIGVAAADGDDLKFAGGRVLGDQIVYPSEARLVSKTPDSSSDEGTPPPQAPPDNRSMTRSGSETYIKTQERNPRDAAYIDTWERFSTRSRPLTLLTELVPRQNGFASKIFRLVSARATLRPTSPNLSLTRNPRCSATGARRISQYGCHMYPMHIRSDRKLCKEVAPFPHNCLNRFSIWSPFSTSVILKTTSCDSPLRGSSFEIWHAS